MSKYRIVTKLMLDKQVYYQAQERNAFWWEDIIMALSPTIEGAHRMVAREFKEREEYRAHRKRAKKFKSIQVYP